MRCVVRYAWSGDVALAYEIVGDGPVDLLLLPGFVMNLDVQWESPFYARFLGRLSDGRRMIVTDRRGCGLSDRFTPSDVSPIEVLVEDLLRVLDTAHSKRPVILSWQDSTMVAQMFAAAHPDRCRGLILCDPMASWLPTADTPWMPEADVQARWIADQRATWGTSFFAENKHYMDDAELAWFMRLQRATGAPGAVFAEAERWVRTDTRDVLPTIRVPTLVIADADGGEYASLQSSEYVARKIPSAQLVTYNGQDQLWWYAPAEPIISEAGRFIAGLSGEDATFDRVLATVMFTDIVESTARAAEVGDHAWQNIRQRHDSIVRSELARFQGREIKTMGDGFLATFDGPARAVRCAQEITNRVRVLDIEIRAGVHIGEIEHDGNDITGIGVAIGARVGAFAQPSEVLVSQTIKDLTAGSGIHFTDRGEHDLKGVPGPWRLYAATS